MTAQSAMPSTIRVAPIRPARIAVFLILAGIVIGAAHLADFPVATRVVIPNVNDADWGRMLRVAGYVPTWILVSLALLLVDRARLRRGAPRIFPIRDMWSRAVLLTASATLSGLLDEGVKLIVRRERPIVIDHHAAYAFRAFSDHTLSTSGLGMPSSHTAVAFGAAFMLCRLHPAATPIWLIIGAGCAATRVLSRAHYVSDAVAGAFLGYAVAWALWQWHAANARRAEARAPGTGSEAGA
jgi:membrane-associated phospholipid phosphatase